MEVMTIRAIGFAVTRGRHPGSYNVRCWVRVSDTAASTTEDYESLTYTEMLDVVLAMMDCHRPGWQMIGDEFQPPLWD